VDKGNGSYKILLLPVEVRVRQDPGYIGPFGKPAMYETPRPDNGDAVGELFSLWEGEQAFVTIGGALGDLIDQGNLPANTVQWSEADLPNMADVKEYPVSWATTGIKIVTLNIAGEEFKIHINIPPTGMFRLDDQALKDAVGALTNYPLILALGVKARNNVQLVTGETPGQGSTRQDALRHSTWNLLAAAAVGANKTLMVTTANEHSGKEGATLFEVGGTEVDTMDAINLMEQYFDDARLRAWTPPENSVSSHHHILRKSDRTKIHE